MKKEIEKEMNNRCQQSAMRNVQMFKYSLGPLFHTQVRAYIIK